MKTLILMMGAILPFTSEAAPKAYYCQAQCVAVSGYQVYLLGSVEANSNSSRKEIFQDMNTRCEKRAAQWGLTGITAENLSWAASKDQQNFHEVESYSSSTSSSHSSRSSFTTAKKITPRKIKGFTHYENMSVSRYHSESHSFHSVDWNKDERSLNVNLTPANMMNSCDEDLEFDPNQVPYIGDQPLQG